MWARTVEVVLGIWLAISWILFGYKEETTLLYHDFSCFFLISCFSLLSYLTKLRHLHLLNFLIAVWLAIFSYYIRGIGFENPAQNYMTLAWLLLMLSIVPTHARRPPYQWIQYNPRNGGSRGQSDARF